MHIAATNICVWIRTLVLESQKEITAHHERHGYKPEDSVILESIRKHTLKNAKTVMGQELGPDHDWEPISLNMNMESSSQEQPTNILSRMVRSTVDGLTAVTNEFVDTTTTERPSTTTSFMKKLKKYATSAATTTTTTTTEAITDALTETTTSATTTPETITSTTQSTFAAIYEAFTTTSTPSTTTQESFFNNLFGINDNFQTFSGLSSNDTNHIEREQPFEHFDALFPSALVGGTNGPNTTSCGRVNIMGNIVSDSAPYLYPFIIQYSLVGATVIYVMWKQIGKNPRYTSDEDLEHRLEVMLSRRAVAMAQAHSGRVDCVGASKGLFFGLLLLVGSLICLILFFVLVHHPQLSLLAIYLADSSHCALMAFSVIAIFIGFIRVQNLKFRCEEQSDLNDILLRISAFGIFIYSTFSIIAGSLNAFTSEPNLLVMVTGLLVVLQVVFQLLFIADVSRRRVHLPEHDRSKPGRQIVTLLLICNISMCAIYIFEAQKVSANPVSFFF